MAAEATAMAVVHAARAATAITLGQLRLPAAGDL
jgi:hypothetical protein